jgi:FkbM family methyltransferase
LTLDRIQGEFPEKMHEFLDREKNLTVDPRLLLIDMTPLSGVAATSALKAAYFSDWRERLLQVSSVEGDRLGVSVGDGLARYIESDEATARAIVTAFRPQIVLYRPVADIPALHEFAMLLVKAAREICGASLALWMMDDWAERLRVEDPPRHAVLDRELRELLAMSAANFAISEGMAALFGDRYAATFEVARNGVIQAQWPERAARRGPVKVRYAGALAPDTASDSVFAAAQAVSRLASGGRDIVFEGRTQNTWYAQSKSRYRRLKGVSMRRATMSNADYRLWLSEADIILVAYNFDEATRRYLKYSFANKFPEALASGAAVLVYGPLDIETVSFAERSGAAMVVSDPAPGAIESALANLAQDAARRAVLGAAGRHLAFTRFDLDTARAAMRRRLFAIAARGPSPEIEIERSEMAQFDECAFAFAALEAGERAGVMIDVGAHVGGSLRPFARAGWRVYAFEPDAANRTRLLRDIRDLPGVTVSAKAVGAVEASGVAFFTSDLSSGISSLSPFHASHHPAGNVDITTLDRLIADEALTSVDFLKIDVEGHEIDVLAGIDFSKLKPRAIVAEFEDAKTEGRGLSVHDLAGRLTSAGYAVFVSEWHSIESYGRKHSWRRLRPYPWEPEKGAWGNLIAFLEPPEGQRLAEAFAAALVGGPAGLGAKRTVDAIGALPPSRSIYRRAADAFVERFPALARRLRPAIRLLRGVLE